MVSEATATRRRLMPVVPRKFEDKAHHLRSRKNTGLVKGADTSSDVAIEETLTASLSKEHEAANDVTPVQLPVEESTQAVEIDAEAAQVHDTPVLHKSRPSLALNITFGDLPPRAGVFPQKGDVHVQDNNISHVSSPTIPPSGSTTSFTQPTPFSETDNKTSNAEQHFESQALNGPDRYRGQAQIGSDRIQPLNETTRVSAPVHTGGHQPAVGAFNPVINGVPLVQNLLQSFNDPFLSDFNLELEVNGQICQLYVHSIVVQMLPPLQDFIARMSGDLGRRSIRLSCPNPFATAPALEAIVRMPYGGPLPGPPRPLSGATDALEWGKSHIATFAAATFFKFTEVADMSAGWLIPLMEHDLNITKLVLECVYADRTEFDHDAPPGHYRDPIKNGRFYHFKLFEAAKSAVLGHMVASTQTSLRRTLDYAAPAAPLLGGFPPAANPVKTSGHISHRSVHSSVSMGDVMLVPDAISTLLSAILLSAPIGFLNLLTRDSRAELMLAAAVKEREDRRKTFVIHHGAGHHVPDRARWEERLERDDEGYAIVNRYEVIRF